MIGRCVDRIELEIAVDNIPVPGRICRADALRRLGFGARHGAVSGDAEPPDMVKS